MMETKLVLLGTGTPNACPNASGPSSAVVVGDRAYLVDFWSWRCPSGGESIPTRELMPCARTG